MRAVVEICVEGEASARAAAAGGADRVEICSNMPVGGVTPPPSVVSAVARELTIPAHVLIRPRAGGFVYDPAEVDRIHRAIREAKEAGASGLVLGLLDAEGRVDREACSRLIDHARPSSVTFHKAFDAARDSFEALDDLIALGVDRVLTSGQSPTAMDGLDTLQQLTRRADGRIAVMAGGSIRLDQVRTFVAAGIEEIHLGSAAIRDGATDAGLVAEIVRATRPDRIYHITTNAEWSRAQDEGSYRPGSLAAEGFIHASTDSQVAGSANRFFRGQRDLVVLEIDPDRVQSPIRWVRSPDSPDPFPHIHGPLDLDSVVRDLRLIPDESGEFRGLGPFFD